MSTTNTTLLAQSHQLHTRGGKGSAIVLSRRTGLPIQHMNPDGSVIVVWLVKGRLRQNTYSASRVRVEHTGRPFFLNGR